MAGSFRGNVGVQRPACRPAHERKARFVIDLTTSRAVPEAEFGKQ